MGDEVESECRQQRKEGNCRKLLIAFHSPEIVTAGKTCAGMLQEKVQQSKLFKAKSNTPTNTSLKVLFREFRS